MNKEDFNYHSDISTDFHVFPSSESPNCLNEWFPCAYVARPLSLLFAITLLNWQSIGNFEKSALLNIITGQGISPFYLVKIVKNKSIQRYDIFQWSAWWEIGFSLWYLGWMWETKVAPNVVKFLEFRPPYYYSGAACVLISVEKVTVSRRTWKFLGDLL